MSNRQMLPLYFPHLSPLRSRSAWFFSGFIFGSLFMLALGTLGRPSLFYNFYSLFTTFYSFYKSETGKLIVNFGKQVINYMNFFSTKDLNEKMRRGDSMVPPFFVWLFQDCPETSAHFLGILNPILLNKLYDKISEVFLEFAVDYLFLDWIFSNNWIKCIIKKVLIFGYTKYIIPHIFSSELPTIFRKRRLTPENMV
ncbi:hypothetical protein C1645_263281 [Glomus cerebriforme]|uniref:Uncharacterized protein n=1 Tax=Glomus cerebriforme TaxID=658196 RepID=A0A397SP71_9GLOM|nr:hypothetical protein C1645_263281 [Glomus cerebriforme]